MSSPGRILDHGSTLAKPPNHPYPDSSSRASERSREATTLDVSNNVDSDTVILASASNLPLSNEHLGQHAITSYFSLIEGRCRAQAVHAINAKRHPQDQLADNHPEVYQLADFLFNEAVVEMKRAGLIPQEVAIPGPQQRQNYLLAFDQRLNDLATRHNASALERYSYKTIEDSNGYPNSGDPSSLFERSSSQALMAQSFMMNPAPSTTSALDALIFPSRRNNYGYESPYYRKFKEICLLGKGGFGQVFRVRHLLDDQDYAVKKIRVSASQLRSIHNELQLDDLLRELRALAKLQHRNVVRYYDSWWEERPASSRNMRSKRHMIDFRQHDSSNSDESDSSQSSADGKSARGEEYASGFDSLHAGLEEELRREAKKKQKETLPPSSHDDMIIFETSNPSSSNRVQPTQSQVSSKSSAAQPLFRKPSEISEEEEESTEDIERSARALQILDEKEAVIFLQMAPYPMTLEDYIWPEQQACAVSKRIQHCFHASITAQILLAILDGVQYVHDQDIVHRDLKPSNIFLSVHTGKVQPEGSINVTACKECYNHGCPLDQRIFLTPHIGDFGLIAKIDDVQPESSFRPSPIAVFSSAASSRQAGTKFYTAPQLGNLYRKVICPKLDVYSIGVIACEMLMKFGTKSERLTVLNEVNKGVLDGLHGHGMEKGIRAMLCHDREKRWDCADIRRWLADFVKAE